MVRLVLLTVFLDMIGFGIVIPLLPLYVRSMGGDAQTVGTLLGAFSLTQLLATPVLGRLSDRVGRRRVIAVSLLGNALSMVVFALAASREMLPLLFASRILAGATAGNLSACQAAVADVTPERDRARAMGVVGAGIGLGMVLGPVLGGVLSEHGAWVPPLVAGALAAVDLALVLVLMPETHVQRDVPASHEGVLARARASVGRPGVPRVLALYFLVFLGMTNVQVALPLLVGARFSWDATDVGHVFALLGLATLVTQLFLIGRLSRALGDALLLALGAALLGGGLATVALGAIPVVLLAGVLAIGLGLGMTNPALGALAARLAPAEARGAVLGLAQSSGGLARTVGPVWSGMLFARLAPSAPFLAGAIAAAVALVLALALRARSGP
ncbi:MFS transporter [Sandaracinus amylolyticus]|uniref:Major facilitator superfamily MFS_1 n=1 Tax=Sandaracinus amylolyticus TaxID=927083 RepID=A0A0F6SE36_9BACT|nr:MFS transporter [Sandaracinus amylolyticus]AKF04509.1 major facilitator superfamily MFS_1 [Sandaracinus amylolyticus]